MKTINSIHCFIIAIIGLGVLLVSVRVLEKESDHKNNITDNMQIKYLDYKDHQIFYEVRGDSEKTLFFIHGWGGSIESWKNQLDSFSEYKVIAIDLPGHGRSSKNENADYTIELFVDSVKAILEKEKVEKAFLLGHSMGFAISEVVALKYPDLCVGIGSIDGAHFELPEDEKELKEWIDYNRTFAKSMDEEKGREDFINALFLPDTPRMLKEEVFATSRKVPLSIGQSIIASMEDNIEFWGKRVMQIPCLAIHSPVYQLTEEYKDAFMTMYPKAEYYEIEGVSHFLMLEVPYRINQLISDYLDKVY